MKKLFALMIGLGVLLGVFHKEVTLMAEVYLGQPAFHRVQKGESLSEIAYQYYGNAYYWRELSLINMAPNPDLILPGEDILIPSLDAIRRLQQAKTISTVKNLVVVEETALNSSPEKDRRTRVSTNEPAENPSAERPSREDDGMTADDQAPLTTQQDQQTPGSSAEADIPWGWVIAAALLIIGGFIGWVIYRGRRGAEGDNRGRKGAEGNNDRPESRAVPRKSGEITREPDWPRVKESGHERRNDEKDRHQMEEDKQKEKKPIALG